MIQRIQTLYLFLAAAALSTNIFLPFAKAKGDAASLQAMSGNFFADGVYWAKEHPAFYGVNLLFLGVLVAIFMFKNRPAQMKIAGSAALGILMMCVLYGVLGYRNAEQLPADSSAKLALGSAFPPVAMLLLMMAYRSIKKDEALVRSSDRLR